MGSLYVDHSRAHDLALILTPDGNSFMPSFSSKLQSVSSTFLEVHTQRGHGLTRRFTSPSPIPQALIRAPETAPSSLPMRESR